MDWQTAISIVSALAAAVGVIIAARACRAANRSAAASESSAQTAKDALAHAQQSYRTSIRPSITAYVGAVQVQGVGPYGTVMLRNAGPGLAVNIRPSLCLRGRGQETGDMRPSLIADLPAGGEHELTRSHGINSFGDVRGVIVYEDMEGRRHWSYRAEFSQEWRFGEGTPPDCSTT